MKDKKKEMDEPTLQMVEKQIRKRGLKLDPIEIYNHYKANGWKNSKGKPIKSVESLICGLGNKGVNRPQKQASKKIGNSESKLAYQSQLQDKRWEAFRTFIFAVRGRKCEKCGSINYLQVHHPKYISGRCAWEYACTQVIVLCKDCHRKEHHIED